MIPTELSALKDVAERAERAVPSPWHGEDDWTHEIYDANGELIGKFISPYQTLARDFAVAFSPATALRLLSTIETLRAANDKARSTLGFFASVIKSGEPWTQTCEDAYREVKNFPDEIDVLSEKLTDECEQNAALQSESATLKARLAACEKVVEAARVGLEKASEAIDTWVCTYADDMVAEADAEAASKRINDAGGTLAYTADAAAVVYTARAALRDGGS